MAQTFTAAQIENHVTYLIGQSRRLQAAGDLAAAYRVCLEAEDIYPDHHGILQLHADLAPTPREKLAYLSRLSQLTPDSPGLRSQSFSTLQTGLAPQPALEYRGETDAFYRVQAAEEEWLIPKNRGLPDPGPSERPAVLDWAIRFFLLALAGLTLAGLGALVFAPAAAIAAVVALRRAAGSKDRRTAGIIAVLSGGLALAALPLIYLFWIHI